MLDSTSSEFVVIATFIAITIILSIVVWSWLQGVCRRTRLRRRFNRAVDAEAKAPKLLRELGYEVLGAQVVGSYVIELDGQPMNVPLRADYLAARSGFTYVAEVKSGKLAPKLNTASTRRQLLEYLVAFQVDGVLLVDAETRRVHEVVFPLSKNHPPEPVTRGRLALVAAIIFAVLVAYLVFGR